MCRIVAHLLFELAARESFPDFALFLAGHLSADDENIDGYIVHPFWNDHVSYELQLQKSDMAESLQNIWDGLDA